jgi:hypothetical protein
MGTFPLIGGAAQEKEAFEAEDFLIFYWVDQIASTGW